MANRDSPLFRNGDAVVLRATLEHGQVISEPKLDGGEYWYKVHFAKKLVWVPEDDLEVPSPDFDSVDSLAQAGRWGRFRAFRTALAIERVRNTNRNTVYSFNAQRILFEPYQYKPLLKLLDSPDRRLLIADEVGLGKTIEAGLILSELEARQPLDKVLVVCPSRLREKWKVEMEGKFGRNFRILSTSELREYLQHASKYPEDARLRAIISMQALRSETLRQELEVRVPSLDMVIVDEAHHGRNPGTLTHALLEDLGRLGQSVLLLTATPLQLGTGDLFSLLHSLRPAEFRDADVLAKTLADHQGIFEAARLARSATPELLIKCQEILCQLYQTGPRRQSPDPLAFRIIEELKAGPPKDRRAWIDLERRILGLHPLSSVLTRTRKREVQEKAPVRKAQVQLCKWTEEEDLAYQQLVGVRGSHGWARQALSLGQIQRARQAASSIHGTILYRGPVQTEDDNADEYTDIPPSEAPNVADSVSSNLPPVPAQDSKFESLMRILKIIWNNNPREKVMIFTYFVGTAKYLGRRLSEAGFHSLLISGEIPSDPQHPERDERGRRVRRFRKDASVVALVSTEVGSEGLDFEFCRHVVNYDLPWNPMVVEQRIGRIDRYGQKAEIIFIHNLVVEDTVEQKILYRLYQRIGIFERSIGDLEAILGETVRELQRDFLNGTLTPEEVEARVEQAAKVIENRRIEIEKLEEHARELFGHEEFIRDEIKRVQRLGRYLTGESIRSLLETYFDTFHPDVKTWEEGSPGVFALHVTDALSQDIREACDPGQFWAIPPSGSVLTFTTDGAKAFNNEEIALLNASHPLVQAAVRKLEPTMTRPTALIGQASLALNAADGRSPLSGLYYIVVFAHHLTGIRARRELEAVVWSLDEECLLDTESAEELLHRVVTRGEEWSREGSAPPLPHLVWDRILSAALQSNRSLRERERLENQATYARRKAALDEEHRHVLTQIRNRRQTAVERDRGFEILRLFDAQIARAESRYRDQCNALEDRKGVTAELSQPIAACAVEVKR